MTPSLNSFGRHVNRFKHHLRGFELSKHLLNRSTINHFLCATTMATLDKASPLVVYELRLASVFHMRIPHPKAEPVTCIKRSTSIVQIYLAEISTRCKHPGYMGGIMKLSPARVIHSLDSGHSEYKSWWSLESSVFWSHSIYTKQLYSNLARCIGSTMVSNGTDREPD